MHTVKIYAACLCLTFIALLLLNFFNITIPLHITSSSSTSNLAITGFGKVDVVPNQSQVNASIVVNNASTQKDAQDKLNQINDNIINSVEKLGIEKKDIQTTDYSISPNYDYQSDNNQITGYNGSASVSILVRNYNKLSSITDALSSSGATDISSANQNISDPQQYQNIARDKAIADAKNQAKILASELGIKLGKIVNIEENNQPTSYPIREFSSLTTPNAALGSPTTIEPGTQTITDTVTLYFSTE